MGCFIPNHQASRLVQWDPKQQRSCTEPPPPTSGGFHSLILFAYSLPRGEKCARLGITTSLSLNGEFTDRARRVHTEVPPAIILAQHYGL